MDEITNPLLAVRGENAAGRWCFGGPGDSKHLIAMSNRPMVGGDDFITPRSGTGGGELAVSYSSERSPPFYDPELRLVDDSRIDLLVGSDGTELRWSGKRIVVCIGNIVRYIVIVVIDPLPHVKSSGKADSLPHEKPPPGATG